VKGQLVGMVRSRQRVSGLLDQCRSDAAMQAGSFVSDQVIPHPGDQVIPQ